ncbi:UTRA domain-containing protein [Nonomuraea sp. PA05]|uniref:UTRA domain-containing protein n=1 Tax=Nonomuraea sp. PA05 TaxID=2604466 RepID=UPI003982DE34
MDDASCARLKVRSASSGILLTRRTHDGEGRCIEFARDVYRADRASFRPASRYPSERGCARQG